MRVVLCAMLWSVGSCVCAVCSCASNNYTQWVDKIFKDPSVEQKVTVSLVRNTPMGDDISIAAQFRPRVQHCSVTWDVSNIWDVSNVDGDQEGLLWGRLHQLFHAGIKGSKGKMYLTALSASDSRRMDHIVGQLKEALSCMSDRISFAIALQHIRADLIGLSPRQWAVTISLPPYPPGGTLWFGVDGLHLWLQGTIMRP